MSGATGFAEAVGPWRREIHAHCYRMLGSAADAEDAVRETFLRAWRGFDRFEGRASVRTWLHQVAVNVCLRLLEQRPRRVSPIDLGGPDPDWHRPARAAGAAELRGSPLSGGYAGAKATIRMITGYAAAEATDLGITATTVLPVITPGTTIGETAIQAYAKASGTTPEQFRTGLTAAPTAESAGAGIVGLAAEPPSAVAGAYLLDAAGLRPLAP